MIFVDRSAVAEPSVLKSARAEAARRTLLEQLQRTPDKDKAQLRPRFENRLWMDCRTELLGLFHGKCAYCETSIVHTQPGDIEHFRPKMLTLHNDESGPWLHLHYAWLAYDWDNLLVACIDCNRRKGGYFPVGKQRAGWLASLAECRLQEQLMSLLDPCYDEPTVHLDFSVDGQCVARTKRGSVTVELLGLNREPLIKARQRRIDAALHLLLDALSGDAPPRQWLDQLLEMTDSSAEHAQAVRLSVLRGIDLQRNRVSGPLRRRLDRLDSALKRQPWFRGAVADESSPAPRLRTRMAPVFKGRAALPERGQETLSRIVLRNFKAIESLTIDLPGSPAGQPDQQGCLVLLGENAAGKSSLLEALALALLGTRGIRALGLDGKRFIRRDEQWNPVAEPAEVELHFDGSSEPAVRLSIDPRKGRFSGPAKPQMVLLGYGPRRYFSSRRNRRRDPQPAARVLTLFDPTASLPNPTPWLMHRSERDFNAAARALRQVLLVADDEFLRRPPRGERRDAELTVQLHGRHTPMERMSDGYRTVVTTAVDIVREMLTYWPDLEQARGVVLIDEVETHLHPRWKMRILQRLRSAMPRVQFIVTTHDPLCLRGAFDREVQVLQRDETRRIESLHELPDVQGLSVEQLLTSEFFGLMSTEDPAFERDLLRQTALAAQSTRSAAEEAELRSLRDSTQRRMKLGRTPQEALMAEAAGRWLSERARDGSADWSRLKPAATQAMAAAWADLRRREGTGGTKGGGT